MKLTRFLLARHLLASCLVGLGGCRVPATQLTVVVDSDISASELQTIQLVVESADSSGTFRLSEDRQFSPGAGSMPRLPISLAVVPRDGDARRRVRIVAIALDRDNRTLVQRSTVTGFISERNLRVDLFLATRCRNVPCVGGTTCSELTGQCIAEERPAASLPAIPANPAGSELRADAQSAGDASRADVASFPNDRTEADGATDSGTGVDAGADSDARTDASRDASSDGGARCTPGERRTCPGAIGLCALATQSCSVAGLWQGCDLYAQRREVPCNGVDEDCDGITDDTECPISVQTCQSGVCACPAGSTECNGACVAGSCSGASDILELSAGGAVACALRNNGRVWCFGDARYLGAGDRVTSAVPVEVSGIDDGVQVTTGYAHSCVRRRSGTVWCWGRNSSGELGIGTRVDATSPAPVTGITDAIDVAAGNGNTCARRSSGEILCWGRDSPISPIPMIAGVSKLVAGSDVMCVVRDSGEVSCWGNTQFILADGSMSLHPLPTPVVGVSGVQQLAAGGSSLCARFSAGGISCWGQNAAGQLGDGTGAPRIMPVPVMGLSAVSDISASKYGFDGFACAVRPAGDVVCWGANGGRQLGDGTSVNRLAPVQVSSVSNSIDVVTGEAFACSRGRDNSLWCWGSYAGRGFSGSNGPSLPARLQLTTPSLANVAQVTAGNTHACARLSSGQVTCWGANTSRALSANGNVERLAVAGLEVPTLSTVTSISAGADTTCAIRADRSVVCWGDNTSNQLGNGSTFPSAPAGAPVTGLTDAVEVGVSSRRGSRVCARRATGQVVCWGNGVRTPVPVAGISDASSIAVGSDHVCALRPSGEVLCWGSNRSGQIGDDTTIDRAAPTPVFGLVDAAEIVAGQMFTCARRRSGAVACWGASPFQGAAAVLTRPSDVPGISNAVEVSASTYACARLSTGQLTCWGSGSFANLDFRSGTGVYGGPDGVVLGLQNAEQIAVGGNFACARRRGNVFCWGRNVEGQGGNGAFDNSSVPVPVVVGSP